jgi:hypothetical protein
MHCAWPLYADDNCVMKICSFTDVSVEDITTEDNPNLVRDEFDFQVQAFDKNVSVDCEPGSYMLSQTVDIGVFPNFRGSRGVAETCWASSRQPASSKPRSSG